MNEFLDRVAEELLAVTARLPNGFRGVVGGPLSPTAATAARKAITSHTPGTEVELTY